MLPQCFASGSNIAKACQSKCLQDLLLRFADSLLAYKTWQVANPGLGIPLTAQAQVSV